MRIHAAALALTVGARSVLGATPRTRPRRRPTRRRRTPAAAAAAGRRSRRCGPTIASSPRTRSPTTGVFTVHRISDRLYYEIPKAQLGQGVPLGQPDRQDDARRRATAARPPATASCAGSGAATASCCAACRTTSSPTARQPIAQAVAGRQQRHDPDGVQHRGARQGRRAGDRGDAPVHDRRARVQRPDARARAHLRRDPLVRRARRVVPGEHRGRSDPHLHDAARAAGAGAGRRPRRSAAARRRRAPGSSSVRHALQHGEAAREADDAAAVRRARRLLLASSRWTTARTSIARRERRYITRWRLEKKDPAAALSEPVKPIVYYIDPATPAKWVPYVKRGDRELAGGVRGGRLQERDHREGRADAGSRIPTGARRTRATR